MKIITLFALATLATSSLSIASANCTSHPKAEWLAGNVAHTKIVAMGYKVKEFKESGNCYKIEGWNKEGQKVDVYFDPKTLDLVKSKLDD